MSVTINPAEKVWDIELLNQNCRYCCIVNPLKWFLQFGRILVTPLVYNLEVMQRTSEGTIPHFHQINICGVISTDTYARNTMWLKLLCILYSSHLRIIHCCCNFPTLKKVNKCLLKTQLYVTYTFSLSWFRLETC